MAECEQRGATIIYATHIFDGLEPWITHLAHVADGRLQRGALHPLGKQRCRALPCCRGCHPQLDGAGAAEKTLEHQPTWGGRPMRAGVVSVRCEQRVQRGHAYVGAS